MELLHAVASGEWMPMPLPQGPIGPALYTNRIIFGREALEIRSAGGSRFAGMFGIKEYPASTRPGLLSALLSAPFELILTQSFAFLSKADAKTVLTRKQNQLVSAQDPAASQIDELARCARRSRIQPLRARRPSSLAARLREHAWAAAGSHEPGAARARRRRRRGRRARTSA